MSRVTKKEAETIKYALMLAADLKKFRHPDYFPNQCGGIWINDAQKRAYLRRMADAGVLQAAYHERGWYRYYTYRLSPDQIPF